METEVDHVWKLDKFHKSHQINTDHMNDLFRLIWTPKILLDVPFPNIVEGKCYR